MAADELDFGSAIGRFPQRVFPQLATAPNFAGIAADENNNMEGPITGFGLVRFVLSQLTNHQYNIKAGDTFLQNTLPTILNSPVWNDPTQKCAIIITWDEDYNNLSLGIGNQGNHVVTIVIPSPGAVASGMRTGAFVAMTTTTTTACSARSKTRSDSAHSPTMTNMPNP